MFRNAWFQVHWCMGITAGMVLALVGFTGGMLSLESTVLRVINPGVITVTPAGQHLSAQSLLDHVQAQLPGTGFAGLTLFAASNLAARVQLAPPPGERRGASWYVNPYTGAVLGAPRGEEFFRTTMGLHRWLLAGAVGKQIVGACTVVLVLLTCSGLYLRWPRRVSSLRVWLTFSLRKRGRGLLWDMHSVVGTWVLPLYLLAALTGLTWSYEWYRNGLYDLAGVERPPQRGPAGPGNDGANRDQPNQVGAIGGAAGVDRAWSAFASAVPAWSVATVRLPIRPDGAAEFDYQNPSPPHSRARSRLVLDAGTGAVLSHDRYADRPLKSRLLGSMLPLHSGEYFGPVGLAAMMLASLLMPLFAITGWLLYLGRRRAGRHLLGR